jgi:3-polyprenyl-4-hydroxybenzoate decarboxylase
MLVRAAVTLFWVEAEDVWVLAAAPVRTRTTTKARTICFMVWAPFQVMFVKLLITNDSEDFAAD